MLDADAAVCLCESRLTFLVASQSSSSLFSKVRSLCATGFNWTEFRMEALWIEDKTSLKQNSSPVAHKDLTLERLTFVKFLVIESFKLIIIVYLGPQ